MPKRKAPQDLPNGSESIEELTDKSPHNLPDGPASIEELTDQYGEIFWDRLDPSLRQQIQRSWSNKLVHMGSFYSGWDAYAIGTSKVMSAAGLRPPVFFRASELEEERRNVIMCHPEETRPRHIFGDQTNHVSTQFLEHARNILRNTHSELQEKIEAGWPKQSVQEEAENSLLTQLHELSKTETVREQQYCYSCNQICPTWDTPDDPNVVVGISIGTCCYDFSKFNAQRARRANVVFDTVIPWVSFACVVSAKQPDFIVEECVPESGFLVKGLVLFLGTHWSACTVYLEPCIFGNPQTGKRRFTVYRNMAKLFWNQELPHPTTLFSANVVATLDVFFLQLSETEAKIELAGGRIANGFHANDETIGWKDILLPSHHAHLAEFIVKTMPKLARPPMAFHVDQTGTFGVVQGPIARRLLTKTVVFHFGLGRFQLPREAMLQMGMPVYREPWTSLLSHMAPDVVRQIAGNALHPMVFSAVLLSTLATARAA